VSDQIKILDNYAEFEYKKLFLLGASAPEVVPVWVPEDDKRRLRSYQVLEAFYRNKGREWVPDGVDVNATDQSGRREYGDPELLVETALSSLIGENWRIVTDQTVEKNASAMAQDVIVQDWAEKVNFAMKMFESERQSVKFGDSVYVLGVNSEEKITLDVYDPGFYFPVLNAEEAGAGEYPEKVHIAWEWEDEDDQGRKNFMVTRLTWELVPTESEYALPWNPNASKVCMYSELTMDIADVRASKVGTMFAKLEDYAPDVEVNMGIDFLPVVHVPNTINLQHHFGRSSIANVMQLLDDIQATDTDLQRSSATTGSPPIVVTGRGGPDQEQAYGPGTVIRVGEGTATIMDTSRSLDALLKMKDSLLSRLSINSRTPEALLGRVKPNEVPSGIALTLGFTPHINLIREMRTVRKRKYNLLFKFFIRLAKLTPGYEIAEDAEEFRTDLVMGSFLPADLSATVTVVIQMIESDVISLETGLRMLLQSGVPIEDLAEEIANIQKRDVEKAQSLVSITGDPNTGLEYMLRFGSPNHRDTSREGEIKEAKTWVRGTLWRAITVEKTGTSSTTLRKASGKKRKKKRKTARKTKRTKRTRTTRTFASSLSHTLTKPSERLESKLAVQLRRKSWRNSGPTT
jgi:hypothetical protein